MKRRDFVKSGAAITACLAFPEIEPFGLAQTEVGNGLRFTSPHMDLQFASTAPELLSLSVDGLGLGKRGANALDPESTGTGFEVKSTGQIHRRLEYRRAEAGANPAAWTFELTGQKAVLTSCWSDGAEPTPVILRLNLPKVHSTVLGVFARPEVLTAPALLHLPGQGALRITADVRGVELPYHSARREPIATLNFPGATAQRPRVVYTLEVTAIYPNLPGISLDPRFDAFKRNWLNTLQLNPSLGALANNTASTSCAFCYYEYADIAALSPPLAPGLTALDVVRQTLDRILAGGTAYGLPAPGNFATPSSDTYPSMLIAAGNCVRQGHSDAWLQANYAGIKGWAEKMLATDTDGNGLVKYGMSGNSGIWPDGFPTKRPSNWWDTIGFGYEDAYANALAFRALGELVFIATRAGNADDAARYQHAADKLRSIYFSRFFNPETGVLGGWRSADGRLHDYYFLWVNGIAIHYGLVPKDKANAIMDKLIVKMKEVGYTKFNMGLPGNLVSVALKDYVHKDPDGHHGGGVRPDNADGFQNYENGGATGCFAFFTLAALYDLGHKAEGDEILFAMLGEYDRGGFEGRGAHGRSNDWRRWDGTPMGYEGFLVDNYYTLLAVPLRQSEIAWKRGFRPEGALT